MANQKTASEYAFPLVVIALIGVGIFLLTQYLVEGLICTEFDFKSQPFQVEAWNAKRTKALANDLILSRRLLGLNREEVHKLLGNGNHSLSSLESYPLAAETERGAGPAHLDVIYGENSRRVERVWVLTPSAF